MLYFSINITNPWSKIKFHDKLMKTGTFFNDNKQWEFNIYRYPVIMDFTIGFSMRESHAGCWLELALLSYSMEFRIYDKRHWNHTLGTWE